MTTPTVLDYVGSPLTPSGEVSVNYSMHQKAMSYCHSDFSEALMNLAIGFEKYALAVKIHYETTIGQDGMLGDHWEAIGFHLRRLLDGETGGLDCASLSANIIRITKENDGDPRE